MSQESLIEKAVEQGGSYEVIRKRLENTSKELNTKVDSLNKARLSEFGSLSQELISTINIHSENNCIPIDMTEVNGMVMIGYNVVMGMKTKIQLEDVFDFYKVEKKDSEYHPVHVPISNTFLNNEEFKKSFDYLFSYYKEAALFQITKDVEGIYIVFQISKKIEDLKVFKFSLDRNGNYVYNGEGSTSYILDKFKNTFNGWTKTTRNNFVSGKHPHISINDKVFVETIGGDLTIKINNDTDTGRGIYSEPVENKLQNLEDSDISFIDAGENVLLRIKPYQENDYRYFIYNVLTQSVVRCDGIGISCVSLPENHGYIFSNGFYLKNGDNKIFDISENYNYLNFVKSPNGEDFLYVFFDPINKKYVLYPYNLVTKSISTPIFTNGYSLHENGSLYVMKAHKEAQRVHPLQLWKTSFLSEVQYAKVRKESVQNFYTKIGNNELVRCISDVYSVITLCSKKEVNMNLYENIIKMTNNVLDSYYWLDKEEAFNLKDVLQSIIEVSVLVVQEFEKVLSIQKQAKETIEKTSEKQKEILGSAKILSDKEVSKYIDVLGSLKSQLGHLITIREQRYIDIDKVDLMKDEINNMRNVISEKIINLLQNKDSFNIYFNGIDSSNQKLKEIKKIIEIEPIEKEIDKITTQISIVNDEINEINFKDATVIAEILNTVSNVFAKINQTKANLKNIKKGLMSEESKIEFTSQINLLGEAVSTAITVSDTVEKCEEQMTKILNKIESLESKFSDFEEYSREIIIKRDEIKDIFETHKQQLINEKQKRIQSIVNNANLTLNSIKNRVQKITTIDDLNSYFGSDALVLKYQQFVENVKNLGDNTKSDDLFSAFKNVKDQSLRQLRDTQDIYEDNGNVLKLGKHKFSVNKTPVDLTMINKEGTNYLHITSTDFYEEIKNEELLNLKAFTDNTVLSESSNVYRSEYLAYQVLIDSVNNKNNLSIDLIKSSIENNQIQTIISDYSSKLYKEGYIKGIHDIDATVIFSRIFNSYLNSGQFIYSKINRTIGAFINSILQEEFKSLKSDYSFAIKVKDTLSNDVKYKNLIEKTIELIKNKFNNIEKECHKYGFDLVEVAKYIIDVTISGKSDVLSISSELTDLIKVQLGNIFQQLKLDSIDNIMDYISIIKSYGEKDGQEKFKFYAEEIAYFNLIKGNKNQLKIDTIFEIEGLIGQHNRVENGKIFIDFEDFLIRCKNHKEITMPAYERVNLLKQDLLDVAKKNYRLNDFKAKPLSSFVRNKLISESYLHLIGDNLAKQMGTIGDKKRTDLMGMLLLISPPGYGKTTIIEYVAQKLGLVFMKINCPSLGHNVTSLDPAEAPDATSKKEIEKINLAFEMGNNVMLYLDDIQHTNPEFLQKFISLCDGSRKVDGVWKGETKTYDFKGKKFSIVMAGNPYTESGEVFKIPDMLSNRADIYNLGDMLSGQTDVFELSYIENSLTANSVLAPLANRNLNDLYKFIDNAKGANHPLNDFEYNYSQAEANEIINVIQKMLMIQKVVLKVNQQYIASAATAEKYRVEPPFKLQGSYRNMNKMSEKIVSAMNESEVQTMILDHYLGEAQTLTQGTEENLLKLKEILNILTPEETDRWNSIKQDFIRNKNTGGDDIDGFTKIAYQMQILNEKIAGENNSSSNIAKQLEIMNKNLENDNESILLKSFNNLSEEIKKLINPEKDQAVVDILKSLNIYILKRVREKQQKKS
jgi:hypothetical protein